MRTSAGIFSFARSWQIFDFFGVILLFGFVIGVLAVQVSSQFRTPSLNIVQSYRLSEIPSAIRMLSRDHIGENEIGEGSFNADSTEFDDTEIQEDILAETNSLPLAQLSSSTPENFSVLLSGQRFLQLDFDLGSENAGDFHVQKMLLVNGINIGTVNVSIDQSSQLRLAAGEIREFLPQEHFEQNGLTSGFVTFEALRSSGVDIRYDPIEDVLLLST